MQRGFPTPLFKNMLEVASLSSKNQDILQHPALKPNLTAQQIELNPVDPQNVTQFLNEYLPKSSIIKNLVELTQQLSAHSFGVLGYLLFNTKTWGDWCALFRKYSYVFGWTATTIEGDAGKLLLPTLTASDDQTHRLRATLDICLVAKVLDYCFTGIDNCKQECLFFAPAELAHILSNRYQKISFEITDGPPEIVFSPSARTQIRTKAHDKLRAFFLGEVQFQAKALSKKDNVTSMVREVLGNSTNLADLSLSQVASELNMSERSLNRHLLQEKTTYKLMLNRYRRKTALNKLFNGQSIESVAQAVGFSERATFERAFKKWQGFTPAEMQVRYALLAQEKNVDEIIHPDNIPNLPVSATRLLGVLEQKHLHIDKLVNIVSQDPGLAAKVMRIAGSALYADKKITSLKQAILTVFGTERLKAIAIMLLSTAMFDVDKSVFDMKKFWVQSLSTAYALEQLYKLYPLANSEKLDFYFLGLFFDIGTLFLAHCLPIKYAALQKDSTTSLEWDDTAALQHLRLGLSGCQASAFLAAYWGLPKTMSSALKHSAKQWGKSEHEDGIVARLLCVARVCHKFARIEHLESQDFCAALQQNLAGMGIQTGKRLESKHNEINGKILEIVASADEML